MPQDRSDRLTAADISQWIDNDEGLYNWARRTPGGRAKFIRENRTELEAAIRRTLGGQRSAHSGPDGRTYCGR